MPRALFYASAIFLFPYFLFASSLPRLTVEDLVGQSDTIAKGKVIRSWAAMDPENRFIWTHYEIQVSSALKGHPGATMEIAEPGGTLDGVTLLIPGGTRYQIGEEVGVFLYKTPIGYLRTTNYGEGKFTMSPDGRMHTNGEINLSGATFAQPKSQPAPGRGVDGLEGLKWNEFESRIGRLVAAGRAAGTEALR